ncbi:MAG: coproporphyrinogen III oxidase [Alphaproteobacteria bacterium]|nr:coproporphyrinogen III oxidase [Alphaproteobacteria bacterium]MBV9692214.1 coproporphyrinogen III oxidase [Alphaproteobacteria bacterium]
MAQSPDLSVPFGIYVHWPFCAAKCPYCDFNSHVRAQIPEDDWIGSILAELDHIARAQGAARPVVQTVFFGGGTPSLMSGRVVGRVLERIGRHWPVANDIEVTLEANPASADAARFADYRAAGVNRLSLGMQALNDADLAALGRLHNVAEAKAALALAQRIFPRVSLDLIYARPGQTPEAWRRELTQALGFGTEHLSLYQLTIEPATPFAALHRSGALRVPDDELAAALYQTTQELTEAAGLSAYEISNHARPGAEARHNLLYWRYGAYAGVGPGAHGRLDNEGARLATTTEKLPERWHDLVRRQGHGFMEWRNLEPAEAAQEHLLMNLRLAEGMDLDRLRARWDWTPDAQTVAALVEQGLLEQNAANVTATRRGRLVLNAVIAALAG